MTVIPLRRFATSYSHKLDDTRVKPAPMQAILFYSFVLISSSAEFNFVVSAEIDSFMSD
jgi:hypothetical protein